ncbi:hypothetical protein HBI56_195500 [Parastagonospora nodorum]|uniref:NadR/Ttd14 AAA domain-containing protein n=2 Tax=Phaeosphaeria nodorum (strain SN15 / ATCC MYA-4574 / FGSC 10173) TaxID=321614 RepID=A0A7U2HY40_PHANO|nr:hypothetical protein SNOG_14811 [Parastagonospora nodorum SN15]KAH3906353.1 hypothetical protein HBH56_207190 [Parastagonospora nodorum]EAT77663.1 hypothetical protein SNOG_14811 [Parastagonospora nodorum SN15]KAH3923770.1 hypothetical protein HBH54_206060 [Parastagonospora nodorum]KAH3942347.1 hypothetical protein HBH53_188320 [Parastagonospora nodorum]KAH3993104.1 hypothetical protein HBI10_208940 [Parastagonospora nodorum]
MKNVYIIGAQSTGKTTLVNAVECKLEETAKNDGWQRPFIIREVARTVLKDKYFSREDISESPKRALQLQEHILAAQLRAETAATALNASNWYICDRSGLDPIVYARYFVGEDAAAAMLTSEAWLGLEGRMKKGIVIVCEAGCTWLIDDGVRLMPKDMEEWMCVDTAFRDLLKTRGIHFSIISKDTTDLNERVEYVEKAIQDALQ